MNAARADNHKSSRPLVRCPLTLSQDHTRSPPPRVSRSRAGSHVIRRADTYRLRGGRAFVLRAAGCAHASRSQSLYHSPTIAKTRIGVNSAKSGRPRRERAADRRRTRGGGQGGGASANGRSIRNHQSPTLRTQRTHLLFVSHSQRSSSNVRASRKSIRTPRPRSDPALSSAAASSASAVALSPFSSSMTVGSVRRVPSASRNVPPSGLVESPQYWVPRNACVALPLHCATLAKMAGSMWVGGRRRSGG